MYLCHNLRDARMNPGKTCHKKSLHVDPHIYPNIYVIVLLVNTYI